MADSYAGSLSRMCFSRTHPVLQVACAPVLKARAPALKARAPVLIARAPVLIAHVPVFMPMRIDLERSSSMQDTSPLHRLGGTSPHVRCAVWSAVPCRPWWANLTMTACGPISTMLPNTSVPQPPGAGGKGCVGLACMPPGAGGKGCMGGMCSLLVLEGCSLNQLLAECYPYLDVYSGGRDPDTTPEVYPAMMPIWIGRVQR